MSNEYEINRTPAPQGFEEVINRLIADAEEQKKGTSRTLELTALGGVTQWLGGMLNAYRIWEGKSGNPRTTDRVAGDTPLKPASGSVVVKRLEWEIPAPNECASSCRLVTFGWLGGWAEIHTGSDGSWWAEIHDDQGQENIAAESLEAAEAVVQEKHAARITSALETNQENAPEHVILFTEAPGDFPVVWSTSGEIEVLAYCPFAKGDELYRMQLTPKRSDEVQGLIEQYGIGEFGDRPGIENAIADRLGVKRPHDLPDGPVLAVDNDEDQTS